MNINKKEIICNEIHICPVQKTLEIIWWKWKIIILWYLIDNTMRTSELKRSIPKISQKMLIQQLKQLQEDWLIVRKVYPVVPPKVEYSISQKWKKFKDIVNLMEQIWKTL
jgi:DNA-binding HxlR family transcriptional regulator